MFDTYTGAGKCANGLEDEAGKLLRAAGVNAEAEDGKTGFEFGVFEAEAEGPNASAKPLRASAFVRAELPSVSISAGPVKAKVGLAADTGASVGPTGLEAKVLGTGFSIGRKMAVSFLGNGIEFNLW